MFSGRVTNPVRPVAEDMEGCGGTLRLERNAAAGIWRTLCARLKHLDLEAHGYCILGNDSGKS